MLHIKNIILSLLVFFQMGSGVSLQHIQQKLDEDKIDEASGLLNKIKPDALSLSSQANYYYLKADINARKNKEDLAYKYYLISKKLYIKADSIEKAMDINLDIAYLISAQENNKTDYSKYINEYLEHAKKHNNKERLARGIANLAMLKMDEGKYEESKEDHLKALRYIKGLGKESLESSLNTNLAVLYNEKLNKPDSALYYLNRDLKYIKTQNNIDDFYHNYVNQASSYYHKKDYSTSIKFLKKADSLPLQNYSLKSKQALYEFLYQNYSEVKDYKNAYNYLLLSNKLTDSAKAIEQNIAINDIQTKYQTREKELENEVLKSNIKTNKALLYIFIGLLLASLIIGFLIVKNVRRKIKISRQEKIIGQQKLEKVLKDYELNSIDMMLEGQDKERQRIANDLHDNLGSMLATLKINFEHLKLRKNELREEETKLYDRTDELIEEAYQKVRRLAHAKNAGVFANEGLIPALKKMADKISIPGTLQISLIPFGFNDRLENTMEIAIFRIVQELSTNIIKHSKATEATIHLTHHDDNINIIIEDNGIGFDSSKINNVDGMGLANIQKKVKQLGGNFTIDSTPGKGTTIIIDLPV